MKNIELDELRTAWQSDSQRLERSLQLNERYMEHIQTQRVASHLEPILYQRILECVFHFSAIVLLVLFLVGNLSETPYALSAAALLAFYAATLAHAWKQINLIGNVDYGKNLEEVQNALVTLQTHIVSYAKMAVLFIPTFLAYPVIVTKLAQDYDIRFLSGFDILALSHGNWWAIQFWVCVTMIPLGIWFYDQVSYRNIHKPWVRNFIAKSSGRRVAKALEFLNELRMLKQGTK
ncbi:MAG TPA: hypothetical protein PLX35_03635 [Cyclobacteriaceae bacterium]|nr:hypothetical protein [Cyclobacteriaceae bacterium]